MADEIYGNDSRVEALWAIKAMEHAEVYFNVRIHSFNIRMYSYRFKQGYIEQNSF